MENDGRVTIAFNTGGHRLEIPASAVERARQDASDMMDDGELKALAAVALAFPWQPSAFVVEIGSYAGTTAAFVAETLVEAGHGTRVLSIDPFERVKRTLNNPSGKYRRYQKTMRARGLENRCLPLVGYSQDAADVVGDRIGVLIVDGNHEFASVERDLALFAPKVLPGGFIFLDDFTPTYPGVIRATEEFLESSPDYELIHRSYYAILQRTGGGS
ncbi:MAG: class I SAM-dependent methyltransferase [Acidimicrobiia bacterium]|nr:class I SAM-dependent methyltransferase [Acidimicrobiia bacterium]NNF88659.1 class I SAM-dependent methyltransferase [Acidimicrobiia bacterium]NNL97827.1 class I SAM-dependent methyltransferase [Acidimicrobiia bacterium]